MRLRFAELVTVGAVFVSLLFTVFAVKSWPADSLTITAHDALQNERLAVLETALHATDARVGLIEERLWAIFLALLGNVVAAGAAACFGLVNFRKDRRRGGQYS